MVRERNLALVDGVIKKESGYRFSKEFIDSLDSKFLLFNIGILRFDDGKFNSYYVFALNDKAQEGIVKFNKDLSFNSFYVVEEPGIENRYDKDGKLICQYFIDNNTYTKSTNGSKYVIGGKYGFETGNKNYYYVK